MGGRRECASGSLARAQCEVCGVGISRGASGRVEPVRIDMYGPLGPSPVPPAQSAAGAGRGGRAARVRVWLTLTCPERIYGVGTSGGASDNVEPVRIDVYGHLDRPLSCTRARGAVPEENGAGMED